MQKHKSKFKKSDLQKRIAAAIYGNERHARVHRARRSDQ